MKYYVNNVRMKKRCAMYWLRRGWPSFIVAWGHPADRAWVTYHPAESASLYEQMLGRRMRTIKDRKGILK